MCFDVLYGTCMVIVPKHTQKVVPLRTFANVVSHVGVGIAVLNVSALKRRQN